MSQELIREGDGVIGVCLLCGGRYDHTQMFGLMKTPCSNVEVFMNITAAVP